MAKPTIEQLEEFFRQIGVGRIGKDELQGLLDIPCRVSVPVTATALLVAVRKAVEKSPLAAKGRWRPDKDGFVAVTFLIAVLPRRKKGYNEVTVREVLASRGLRLPTIDELFVCLVDQKMEGFNEVVTCDDGSCIASLYTEHSVHYLAIEALAPDAETMSCDCDCAIDETVDDVGGRCETGVFPCRSK